MAPPSAPRTGLTRHGAGGTVTAPMIPAARRFSMTRVAMKRAGVNLVALYAPEHGIDGTIRAGVHVRNARDSATGLPVYSLYGDTRKPTPRMLAPIDTLVFDLQDIGARSYTYISTMAVAMEACAENGKEFVVLDRPNPLGGIRVEGPPVADADRSGLGVDHQVLARFDGGDRARRGDRAGAHALHAALDQAPEVGREPIDHRFASRRRCRSKKANTPGRL